MEPEDRNGPKGDIIQCLLVRMVWTGLVANKNILERTRGWLVADKNILERT